MVLVRRKGQDPHVLRELPALLLAWQHNRRQTGRGEIGLPTWPDLRSGVVMHDEESTMSRRTYLVAEEWGGFVSYVQTSLPGWHEC
jgi:hypothetical protein